MAVIETRLGDFPIMIGGSPRATDARQELSSPYDGSAIATVHLAAAADVEDAIGRAVRAFEQTRRLASWQRERVLEQIAEGIAERRDQLAQTIALEAGKPLSTALGEVDRAVFTFRVAAEESKRLEGRILALDWLAGNEGRRAELRPVPLGPISGITPFNFPLNLVAHKVAPALAAGNPILLKPAPQTPLTALALAEIVSASDWPADGFAVLPCTNETATPLIEDERIKMLSFTGSPGVGWTLKARAGRKRVTLELGGNAAVIVGADTDVPYAAERIVWGAFTNAGQACISVQRVYAHTDIAAQLQSEIVARTRLLKTGDPLDPATDVGPVIDGRAADRIGAWLAEATAAGAVVLTGGQRDRNVWQPTVLTDVREDMRVSCEEVFAPLLSLVPFDDVDAAIAAADTSQFGLQAGIFTNDTRTIERAFDRIEVGGLMVNDVPTFRIDHMPYGGLKQSGQGREGVRYAIEEMTQQKLLTINSRP
ncbi:MAG: aldehyde dehydrogenase family protein [Solirubrobacterales bacterium]|nr:aldehyde dehydrogenase family protein [Solirubrobacterales bacterium]